MSSGSRGLTVPQVLQYCRALLCALYSNRSRGQTHIAGCPPALPKGPAGETEWKPDRQPGNGVYQRAAGSPPGPRLSASTSEPACTYDLTLCPIRAIVTGRATVTYSAGPGDTQPLGMRTQSAEDSVHKYTLPGSPADLAKRKARGGHRPTRYGIMRAWHYYTLWYADFDSADDLESAGRESMRVRVPPAPPSRPAAPSA